MDTQLPPHFSHTKSRGKLHVICGSMFSGKTEELMRQLGRANYAKKNVITVKHRIDDRYGSQSQISVTSHDGRQRTALLASNATELERALINIDKAIDVVGIDEIQFFDHQTIQLIYQLVQKGIHVVVAGLDLDFRGEPFGIMPSLLTLADDITKLKAVCVICGHDAHHTQRLVNGDPARYDDPLIAVGASEMYQARCRLCFKIDKNSYTQSTRPIDKHPQQEKPASINPVFQL